MAPTTQSCSFSRGSQERAGLGESRDCVNHSVRAVPMSRKGDLSPETMQWHPTPVLLPGKSHGQRSLVGCSPRGHQESDTTEREQWFPARCRDHDHCIMSLISSCVFA